ncbi:MAG TPA: adenylate/guanylate cyclase domain-containing protein [Longimicrobiales bacterium]|nr:adenylate/guanylate cyclase domain-containing protein [Longimicrobiales bacterium]
MKYRRQLIALSIATASALASYALIRWQFVDFLFGEAERKTVDYRVRATRSTNRDSGAVALVLFDTATVTSWPYLVPFPRAALADLVRTAAANGAAVIGLDVFLDRQYPELSQLDNGDERLRDAIRAAGNVVLVAPTEQQGATRRLLPPDPYFADVAAAVATADLPTPYETTREAALVTVTDDGAVPGFALALYAIMHGLNLDSVVQSIVHTGRIGVAGLPGEYARLSRAGSSNLPIRFSGPPSRPDREEGAFVAYSGFAVGAVGTATGFTANPAFEAWMKGKAVLLGSGFHDSERFRSPYYDHTFADGELAGWTYGVEIHANALQNLLERDYLVPAPRAAVFAVLLLVALVAAGSTFWRGAKQGVLAAGTAVAVAVVGALVLFQRTGVTLPVIGPALAAVLAYTSAVAYVSIVEGREKRMIRGAFSKYVPPGVVDDLVADPSRLKLGGEKRTVSILFSDIAGFTSMSEVLPPEMLVSILNEYLDEMSDILFDELGTLDKYIGDAIMALWGAPTPVPDHELRACRTAVRMQRRLHEWNEEWRARRADWSPLRIRIGVNTGTPVVGNIGGEKRFDYTALGDAVNLAARLEPACKSYGVSIMIAEPTRAAAGDAIIVRELDMLAVYGKAESVRVYELVGMAGDAMEPTFTEALQHYDSGLAAYRRRDFELALSYFEAALELYPEDGPSQLYRERSVDYIMNPPPADWDFVERRQVK